MLRILLAEDSVVNQKLALGLLKKHGHEVVVANNGREAVELAGANPFDLILMDVQMPELDGFEATRAIRLAEQATDTHVPIIALTAHAMQGDRERCLDVGMDSYISKPVRARDLYDTIADTMADYGRPDPGPQALDDSAAIDWGEVLAAVQGNRTLLKELAVIFLEEYPGLLVQARQGLTGGDAASLQRAAHTLKGSVRQFGATSVCEQCDHLEKAARNGDPADTLRTLVALEAELQTLGQSLQRFLADAVPGEGRPAQGRASP
jgi:CheY-like chemotaxis protein